MSGIVVDMLNHDKRRHKYFINPYTDAAKDFEPVLQEVKSIDAEIKKLDPPCWRKTMRHIRREDYQIGKWAAM